ncbi:MAG: hypothetical protein H6561_01780 [Lewinellaceae bacterium]|nr:hypothetical protein [Lewinellaceae bacterium]
MNWTGATGNPRLSGTALQAINISGSMTLIPAMQYNHLGDVTFEGNEGGLIIDMAGFRIRRNLNFKGGAAARGRSHQVLPLTAPYSVPEGV